MYFYIYTNINFLKILNQPIRTYLGILGIVFFGLKIFEKKKININKEYIILGSLSILLMIYWEIGSLINYNSEITPFKIFFFKQSFNIIRSYCIYITYKYVYKRRFYFKVLLDIVKVVILDNTLAVIRYFIPVLNQKIASLQASGSNFSIVEDLALNKSRLVGVGEAFFGAGIINSIVLVIIIYLIFVLKSQQKKLMLAYIYIAIVGSFSSRTTIIGILVSIIYYSILNSKKMTKLIKKLIYTSLMFSTIVALLTLILFKSSVTFRKLYTDFFIKQGKGSLKVLGKMWDVFPKEEKTLIFGDFRWHDYSNGKVVGYYMHTDIGYLRVIWAIGILGLIVMFSYNFYLWLKIKKRLLKPEKLLIAFLFLMQIIFNYKGFVDTFQLLYFFLIVYKKRRNLRIIRNKILCGLMSRS